MAYGRQADKSKRQERVGHLVRAELADILRLGFPVRQDMAVGGGSSITEDLRRRISIVDADVAPDLRQARITVSIIGDTRDGVLDKRRAYSWLVAHTKPIRHALAKRMDHLKVLPELTFVQADVGAAVDVMNLIDRVSNGDYKRQGPLKLGEYYSEDEDDDGGELLRQQLDFDDDGEDDDGWIEDDDDDDEEFLLEDEDDEEEWEEEGEQA